MSGRLVYADVPHRRERARWLDPLLLGSNAALYVVHLAVTPTSEVVFREPLVPGASAPTRISPVNSAWLTIA